MQCARTYLKIHHVRNWNKKLHFLGISIMKKETKKSSKTINWASLAPNNFGIFCLDRKENENEEREKYK